MSNGEGASSKPGVETKVVRINERTDGGWRDIVAGGISGGITRMLIAPLDVIKIRFQVQTGPSLKGITHSSTYHYSGIIDSVRTIFRQEGFTAFWNGNMLAEILYVAYIGAQFGSYAFFHDGLLTMIPTSRRESSQATVSFVSGGLAAFVAVSLTYPLDLLRTRFAAQAHPRTYQSIGQASHLIMKTDGILGFYSGWAPTTFALVPSMAVQFALYDWCKRTWFGGQEHANPLVHAVAGGFSGIVSKLAVLPLDVLKKRLQIQGLYQHRSQSTQNQLSNKVPNSATPPSPAPLSGVPHTTTSITTRYSAKDTVKMIYKYEGLPGFFRGAVPSTLKAGVSASLTFTFYEQSKRLLLSMLKNVEGKPH